MFIYLLLLGRADDKLFTASWPSIYQFNLLIPWYESIIQQESAGIPFSGSWTLNAGPQSLPV